MRLPSLRKSYLAIILAAILSWFSIGPFSITSRAQDYPPLPPCGFGVLIFNFHFLGNDYSVLTVTIDCGGGDVCSASAVICSCGTVDFSTDCFDN